MLSLEERVSKLEETVKLLKDLMGTDITKAMDDLYDLTNRFNELNEKVKNMNVEVDHTTSFELLKLIKDRNKGF